MDYSMPGFRVLHYFLKFAQLQSRVCSLKSIESVIPSNLLVLCCFLLLLPPIPPSIRVFSNESVLCRRWPKYRNFCFSINPSNEYSGLIPEFIDISPGNLDSSCASSSPAFCMMYLEYKLNKQGDNIQPWCTPFSILNQSIVPCLVLTVASWPAFRFLRKQVRWSGIPISWRIFHSLLWSTQSKALA